MEYLDAQNKPIQKKGLYIHAKDPLKPIIVIETEEQYHRFCEEGRTQDYSLITNPLESAKAFKKAVESCKKTLDCLAGSPTSEGVKKLIERSSANYITLIDYLQRTSDEPIIESNSLNF